MAGGGKLRRGRGAEQASGPTPWVPASDALHGLVAPHEGDGVVSTILIVASAPGDPQNRGGTSVA